MYSVLYCLFSGAAFLNVLHVIRNFFNQAMHIAMNEPFDFYILKIISLFQSCSKKPKIIKLF